MTGVINFLMSTVVFAAVVLVPPLLITLCVELPVAVLFRVGKRGLAAVTFVNLVTNPAATALVVVFYSFGVGFGEAGGVFGGTWLAWAIVAVMEVFVIWSEWRLLLWALRDTAGSQRRLLSLSIVMNVGAWIAGSALVLVGQNVLGA